MTTETPNRLALVRRGLLLNWLTIGYNSLEAVFALAAGMAAGSVALVGFGADSVVEVTSSLAAQWRLRADHMHESRVKVERRTRQIIGVCFLVLALYVGVDAAVALWEREAPARSILGMIVLALSVVVMPWLASQKRVVARALSSEALKSDAVQTALCAYLSAIGLAGVALNLILGWWWADPVAALVMVPIIAKEGIEGVQRRTEHARTDT
jgi:divalent metal cation (Fe/Co/Zn/Cd) transporter